MFNSSQANLYVPVLLCSLMLPLVARGDGCVIDRLGRYVPEKEQRAFIEWKNGHERLYVATRTAPTEQASLWIVPIRAAPDRVWAEPVETAPRLVYYQPIAARARQRLEAGIFMTAVLDTGLLPCALLPFIGCEGEKRRETEKDDVREHRRVEKYGMIVTVVSAITAEGLDRYLADNGIHTSAAQLVGLTPYLGQEDEYSLVCGWMGKGGKELTARAVRVDFPTPTIFYPLQPTRVYESVIPTVVYVRGLVRPVADLAVPGATYTYLHGNVTNLESRFVKSTDLSERRRPVPESIFEELTRVELTSASSSWTSDLVMEPSAPPAIAFASLIDRGGLALLWAWSIALGMLLSVFLPRAILSREQRCWKDWLWAATVGAATGLSVWVSVLVLVAWARNRFPGQTSDRGVSVFGQIVLLLGAPGAIAILLFVAVFLLGSRIAELGVIIPCVIGAMLLITCLLIGLVWILGKVGSWARATCFALFVLAHGSSACLLFFGLRRWLAAYE
jgi:hypothetical protein